MNLCFLACFSWRWDFSVLWEIWWTISVQISLSRLALFSRIFLMMITCLMYDLAVCGHGAWESSARANYIHLMCEFLFLISNHCPLFSEKTRPKTSRANPRHVCEEIYENFIWQTITYNGTSRTKVVHNTASGQLPIRMWEKKRFSGVGTMKTWNDMFA